jgi:serine/threonine protein phosphatase 1
VWAISSIHGELNKLYALHDALLERLRPGDRIVYLGNYTGHGAYSRETIDELLTFRRLALSYPGMHAEDIVYLRGHQENLWHQLLQIQFTQHPTTVLENILNDGVRATLTSYGINADDGMRSAREGVLAMTRWTTKIREAIRANPGHQVLMMQYRRAAYLTAEGRFPMLFVHAGIDPQRSLEAQGDILWSGGQDFGQIIEAYKPFDKVIRGYDPLHEGLKINCVTASLDGGCGFGGSLVCAGLDPSGKMLELMEA